MSYLRDMACLYGYRGWAVLPLLTRSKAPNGILVPHGMDDATTDLAAIFRWWRRFPNGNIGINCRQSNLLVIDVDPRNGGADTLWDLQDRLGELPRTVVSLSGGGGEHWLFQNPGGVFRRSIGDGVDIKDRGYIVAPPSLHPSGGAYAWSVDGDPEEVGAAEIPERWLERMRRPSRKPHGQAFNSRAEDSLRWVAAADYVPLITGRLPDEEGWVQCPFHKNGQERTPSMKIQGTLWACFACEPRAGQTVAGGNIYDLAALTWHLPLPLRGKDFGEVRDRLKALL